MRILILFLFSLNVFAIDIKRLNDEMDLLLSQAPEAYENEKDLSESSEAPTEVPLSNFKTKRKLALTNKKADLEAQKNLEKVEDIESEFFKDEVKTYLSAPEKPKKVDDIPGDEASDLSQL